MPWFWVALAVPMVIAAWLISSFVFNPVTIYVDGGVAVSGDGTQAKPFRTINEAISYAESSYTVYPRKRVEVASGYYPESVTLVPRVDLVSPRVGAAIINGGGSRSAGLPTVTGSNDSSVTGFVITGGHPAGVLLSGVSTHLRRNIIRGNYGSGIACNTGCTAIIENNTVIGQIRNDTQVSTGISVSSGATPVLRNNIVYRQDVGISRPSGAGSEAYNLAFDNDTNFSDAAPGVGSLTVDPGFVHLETDDFRLSATSPARQAGDPSTFNSDGTRADMGAFDRSGGYPISLAAQEWALESIFSAYWTSTGILQSNGSTTPIGGDPTFWLDPTIAGDPAIEIVKNDIMRGVQELSLHWAKPKFVTGTTPPGDPCHIWQVTKSSTNQGTPYLASWVTSGSDCVSGTSSSLAGLITGGKLQLGAETLESLLTATPTDPVAIIHELGHAYGGIYHCFRTTSPIAYGPQSTDYGDVEAEALALRAASIGSSLSDWFAWGYLSQAILHPFPAVEGMPYAGMPPVFHVGKQELVQGSRFTMTVSSEQGSAYLSPDYETPTVYFNDLAITSVLATTGYGGATRNIYVTPTTAAKSGWLTVRVRGVESIPVRVTVVP
jgi:hypothetical protein